MLVPPLSPPPLLLSEGRQQPRGGPGPLQDARRAGPAGRQQVGDADRLGALGGLSFPQACDPGTPQARPRSAQGLHALLWPGRWERLGSLPRGRARAAHRRDDTPRECAEARRGPQGGRGSHRPATCEPQARGPYWPVLSRADTQGRAASATAGPRRHHSVPVSATRSLQPTALPGGRLSSRKISPGICLWEQPVPCQAAWAEPQVGLSSPPLPPEPPALPACPLPACSSVGLGRVQSRAGARTSDPERRAPTLRRQEPSLCGGWGSMVRGEGRQAFQEAHRLARAGL